MITRTITGAQLIALPAGTVFQDSGHPYAPGLIYVLRDVLTEPSKRGLVDAEIFEADTSERHVDLIHLDDLFRLIEFGSSLVETVSD